MTSMRSLFGAALAAWFLSLGSSSLQQPTLVVHHNANLRASASTQSEIKDHLEPGDELTQLDPAQTNGFYHVRTATAVEGWIYRTLVHVEEVDEVPTAPATAAATTFDTSWTKPPLVGSLLTGPAGTQPCPADGEAGGDLETNRRKNRKDTPASYHEVTFDAVMSLPDPDAPTKRNTWDVETFPTTPANRVIVKTRTTSGRVPPASWTFDWQNSGATLVITGPANKVTYETTTVEDVPVGSTITVATLNGTIIQTETLTYQSVPNPVVDVPVLHTRTLVQDGVTYTTTYSYSPDNYADYGQPSTIQETGQLSRTTTFAYEHNFTKYIRGRVLSTTVSVNGEAHTQTLTYNGTNGFLLSSSAFGRTATFTDDGRGNVGSARDPLNHLVEFSYDWGVVKNTTTPEYGITRTLNDNGTVDTETRGSTVATYGYDAIGRLISIGTNTPGRAAVTTTYNIVNGVWLSTTTTQGDSSVTTDLDGYGRATHVADAAGVQSTVTFDPAGRQIYASYPFGGVVAQVGTTFTYDALGRVTSASGPDGSLRAYEYLGTELRVGEFQKAGTWRITRQFFQAFGAPGDARLSGLIDAQGATWMYSYDNRGNLVVVDSNVGPTRTWIYNDANLLWKETHPESGLAEYEYDTAGNLTWKPGPNGPIHFEYDNNNRVKRIDPPGTEDDVTITYDAFDRPLTLANAAAQSTFVYDTAGRMTSRTDVISGRTFVQQFEYDGNDNLHYQWYPVSNRKVTYDYGPQHRLTAVKTQYGTEPERTLASNFVYPPSSASVSFQYGNGQTRSLTFDVRQRPQHLVDGPLDIIYGYDQASNVRSITDVRPDRSSAYDYDLLDRLTAVTGYGGPTSFTYDGTGDRLTTTDATGTTTFNYNAQWRLDHLSGNAAGAFTYNGLGSVLSDPTPATYSYTGLNMMKTATVAGSTTAYRYAPEGQRAVRVDAAGVESYFLRGPGGLVAEYRGFGDDLVLQREYVYIGGALLASITPNAVALPNVAVSLATPTVGQIVVSGQTITLTAHVPPPQTSSVARVEYYQGGLIVGSSTDGANNYPVLWNNLPLGPGSYTFRARVVLTDGRAASSTPVTITVQ